MAGGIVHPGSLVGVAHVFQSAYPNMTAEVAVANAREFIRGLHMLGLEVGPIGAFGPQAEGSTPFDGLNLVADMIEKDTGRKPWLPDGFRPQDGGTQ